MKVLIINTVPFTRNGITSVIMNYYGQLKNEVTFDFLANSEVSQEYEDEIQTSGSQLYFFKNRKKNFLSYTKFLKTIVKNGNYDIVHIHGNSSLMSIELFAIGNKVKTIVHGHNVTTDYPLIHKLLYPYFITHYDFAFVPSKEAGNWLFQEKQYYIIENGIELDKYKFNKLLRDSYRKTLGLTDKNIILNVSNFSSQKNQSLLIEILPSLLKIDSTFYIVFIGEGIELDKQKAKVLELGIEANVTFLGSREDVSSLYSAADFFAFPTNWESLGLVAVEAQANGLPVAMSDTVPEIVKVNRNVKFLSNDSPSQWIEFILKEKRINQDSNVELEKFDIKLSSIKLKNLYEEIINQKSKKKMRENNNGKY